MTMMQSRQRMYLHAAVDGLKEEMRRDERVILMGEDIRSKLYYGEGGTFLEEFGPERVRNTPMSEAAFIGAGIGAAMTGLRPVIDVSIASFLYVAMDQLITQAAKSRYMFGGQATIPLVIRATCFYQRGIGAQHSDRPYPLFMSIPGLKVLAPSTPYDAKGLLKAAVRDDDVVLLFEDVTLHNNRGDVPEDDYVVPIGKADVKRVGTDVTVVAVAGSVPHALAAANDLAKDGISVEVIDPRTLVPLDSPAILKSVIKTGLLVVVDPAHRTCSAASEISAIVAEEAFDHLRGPIVRITTPQTHVPFSPALEKGMYPDSVKIAAAVRGLLTRSK